ncbi:hypothetical protein ACEN9Z_01425 [Stenotrophomonas geniculata]
MRHQQQLAGLQWHHRGIRMQACRALFDEMEAAAPHGNDAGPTGLHDVAGDVAAVHARGLEDRKQGVGAGLKRFGGVEPWHGFQESVHRRWQGRSVVWSGGFRQR